MPTTPTTRKPEARTKTRTAEQFRRRAERSFRKANPEAVAVGLVIEWTFTSRPYVGKGDPRTLWRTGTFRATAPGFASRLVGANLEMVSDRMSVGI